MPTATGARLVALTTLSVLAIAGCGSSPSQQGKEALRNQDFARAIRCLSEAIRLDPHQAENYYLRGVAYLAQGEDDNAIADLTAAIRLDPNDARAYRRRAAAHFNDGGYSKAIADLTAAIRLDPNDAGAYYDRGVAYASRGETGKAEADFAQAKDLGFAPPEY